LICAGRTVDWSLGHYLQTWHLPQTTCKEGSEAQHQTKHSNVYMHEHSTTTTTTYNTTNIKEV
jgi:hypothetical protein